MKLLKIIRRKFENLGTLMVAIAVPLAFLSVVAVRFVAPDLPPGDGAVIAFVPLLICSVSVRCLLAIVAHIKPDMDESCQVEDSGASASPAIKILVAAFALGIPLMFLVFASGQLYSHLNLPYAQKAASALVRIIFRGLMYVTWGIAIWTLTHHFAKTVSRVYVQVLETPLSYFLGARKGVLHARRT